jgi:hypothetical protein
LISEHEFAYGFDSLWESLFPLLSPSFVRDFNARQGKGIGRKGRYLSQVPMTVPKWDADLVTELAFELFRLAYENGQIGEVWRASSEHFDLARQRTLRRFGRIKSMGEYHWLNRATAVPSEARSLANGYAYFFAGVPGAEHLTFRPEIRGAGILSTVEGDICTPKMFIEVKTVKRNLTSHDFRQLLVYLALGLGSGQYSWEEATFLNPRRSLFYTVNISSLVSYLSARNVQEVFDEFLFFLSEREMDPVPNF